MKVRSTDYFIVLIICILLIFAKAGIAQSESTYANGYQNRRAILISHLQVPNSDQTNFPALISGAYPYLATVSNGGLVQNANGYDIVFASDPEGASPLSHEIDTYDPVTGTVNFWVAIPTLSHSSDTAIYMFYGDPSVTVTQENKAGVWLNGYAGVWHFGSGTTLNPGDSTVNANNATVNGSPSVLSGEIASAANFSGGSDNFAIRSIPLNGVDYTVSSWFHTPLASTGGGWNTLTRGVNNDHQVLVYEGNWHMGAYANQGGGFWDSGFAINSLSSGWHYLAASATGSTTTFYIDGARVGSIPFRSAAEISFLGNYQGGSQQFGKVDEVRVSSGVARSADWITTEYNNQSAPSDFYSVGGQATPTSAPTTQSVTPGSGTVGSIVTIQGFGFQATQGASTVTFNGIPAVPTNWNDAAIVVPVPTGATSGNVVVTVGGVASNGVAFEIYAQYNGQGYSSGYEHRRTIVLDHTKVPNTDQHDFPVLISGVYPYLATVANGGLAQNQSGYDIIFSQDAEGATKLDHEIDSYDPITGTVSFWVRIPMLSHTADTVIYMLYGNPAVTTSQENKAGVWRSNYLSVYHLGSGTAIGLADSGSAGYNLSGSASAVNGRIGGGAAFSGNPGTYLYYDSVNAYPSVAQPVTLETWVQFGSGAQWEIVGYGSNSANGSRDGLWWDGSNLYMEFENMAVESPVSFDSKWHHVVGVYTGGPLVPGGSQLYMDGTQLATTTSGGTPAITTNEFKIGGIPTVTSCCALNGSVDEVRVSSGTRSADWIATEYANESAPSTFYVVESEATANSAPTIQFLSPASGTPGSTIAIEGYGFQASQSASTVTFNGTSTIPTSWNDAMIVAPVPVGVTSGNVVVTAGGVASNGAAFTVLPFPSITSVQPPSGGIGATVTIAGANFGSSQGSSTVTFNGVTATPTAWSPTSITVAVPMGATSGNVIVTAGGGQSNGVDFVVPISGISPQSGMVGTYVTLSGSGFGVSQGTSTVSLNGTQASVASWSDSSVVAIVPTGATSGPFSVAINGQTETSPIFTVTSLPSGWTDADTGPVSYAGSATYANGVFTVAGSGQGINGNSDAMNFMYQTVTGDASIVVRLRSNSETGQAGVMIRETLNPAAAAVTAFYGENPASYLFLRPSIGASTQNLNYYGVYGFAPPEWLKLTRSGDTFAGYVSSDGREWTELASTTVTMAQTVYIGTAVSGLGSLETASFDNVAISSTAAPAPVITSLSATSGQPGTQVSVIGNNFGSTQGGSVVLLNGSPVTINAWDNEGILFTVPSGATSGLLVVSVAPQMTDSNAVEFEVTTQPLPTSWLNEDVGLGALQAGNSVFSNGTFTLTGGGSGIGGTADSMQFVYQPLSGDGVIVARLVSVQDYPDYPPFYSQAGLMIRETLDADASQATVLWGWNNALYMLDRPSTGASSVNQNSGLYCCAPPVWLQLVRAGNTLTGSISTDGIYWTQLGSTTITMAETVYVGLAMSGTGGKVEPAVFDGVSINSTASPAPVITGLSATTASVGNQIEITGNNFGAAQGSSVVLLNGDPMTVNLWGDTSIVVTVPSGATSGALLVAVAPTMNDSNPVYLDVTSRPLPTPWVDQDVGSVGTLEGSATYSSGTFTVAGGGASIGGTADAMHFVYQTLTGDGSIVGRLTSLESNPYPGYPQAGVVIRESLSAGAAEATAFFGYNNATYMEQRPSAGATIVNLTNNGVYGFAPPEWLELVRVGNTLTGYISSDGSNWTQLASTTVSMAQTVYIGLVVSGNSYLKTGTFDNVSVVQGTTPFVSSVSPVVGTVGTPVTITGSNFGTTQGSSAVTFNGATVASVTSWSPLQIVATVPSSVPVGTGPVIVSVNSTSSPATSGSLFTVIEPVISSLSPPSGPLGGTLVINGYGFGASQNGSVHINGVVASVQSSCQNEAWYECWSDTQIQVSIPSNATSGPVTVTNDGISSNQADFTVTAAPSILTISPSAGTMDLAVTINGTGFGATQSSSSVAFAGFPAAVNSWSDSQIIAVVPQNAYSGDVTVTVAGVTVQGPLFIVDALTQITASNGAQSTYTSTGLGGGWGLKTAAGPGCSTCSFRGNMVNNFDDFGNIISHTDANGNVTSYTYDGNNNMTSETRYLNGNPVTTSYAYNGFGEVLTMTDALGNMTTNAYDAHGNLVSVTSPAPNSQNPSSITQFVYDTKGELIEIIDPIGHPTYLHYYSTGLIQNVTDAQNNVTSYGYDQRGNRTSVADPINGGAHPTIFAYDIMSRLTGITYPDGTSVAFGYDSRGRRTSATDQDNRTTIYGYDDADHLTSVTDPANHLTQYAYDTEDNLTSITDANNHTTYFTYDTLGRVTQTTFPSGLYETYGYDQLVNLTSKTDRKNQTIQYVYDSLDRLASKVYPDQTAVDYLYDLVGKIRQVTDPTGVYSFAYDNIGRLIATTTQYSYLPGYNFQNSYTYDAASNRKSLTAPDGSTNTYNYDTLNRLSTLTNSLTGQFGFGYDALSRRTQMTRPNGINTNYGYDSVSHLLSVLHRSGGTTLDGAGYTYDYAGNRTSKTNYLNGTTSNYGYDLIYELSQVTQGGGTTESYSYDNVGNRLSSSGVPTYSYNASNELTAASNGSYSYDANGNTLSDAQGRSFTWDFENRLTQVVNPGVGTTAFKYDPFGRRIQKSGPLGTTNYLYDGPNLLEEIDSSGNVLARYTQGPTIDQPLAELRGSTTDYYEADALGSVTSLSNGTGTLANTYTYDSFGNVTNSTGSLSNPFRYTGREFDSETSLYFNRARYYDQNAGRFVSEDPSEFVGGQNFYAYVGNDPINLTDPLGLTDCVVTATAVVCTNWGPGLNWMTPQEPQPPQLPSDLTPNPPPPPAEPPCSCNNWLQREGDEIDQRSLRAIGKAFGITGGISGLEHWGPRWLKPILPWGEGAHLLWLEYELWDIQHEVSAKYAHCH